MRSRQMHRVVGHIVHERTSGETIRDTFGDYITDESGKVTYFEPGVLAAFGNESVEQGLKLWAEFSDSDGGILDRVIDFPDRREGRKDARPDQAGQLQVSQSPARRRDRSFLAHRSLHRRLQSPPHERGAGGGILRTGPAGLGRQTRRRERPRRLGRHCRIHGREVARAQSSDEQRDAPGTEKCIAIVYQGEDAVRKIREVLGPTDPSKAPPGSIRKEFGQIDHDQRRARLRFGGKRASARWGSCRSTRITSNL